MSDKTLDLLEKRIAEIEKHVFGSAKEKKDVITIAESLLNAHTMITSALSCRDNIDKVLQRLPELNEMLDPLYSDNQLEIAAKRNYILLLYPDLKDLAEQLNELSRVAKFVDSESITDVSKLSERLDMAVATNANTYMNCTKVTEDVMKSINQYNDLLTHLEVLMMQFDQSACEIERELQPKKPSTSE